MGARPAAPPGDPPALDAVWVGDARNMDTHGSVADRSVGLVVTSPPYFAGKEYEQAMAVGHGPADVLLDPEAAARLAAHGSGGGPTE